jgi:hypothetical protein
MPTELEFPDRIIRVHFECSVRKHCGLKANISLPRLIREYQAVYLAVMRTRHMDKMVVVRPNATEISLDTFLKGEGHRGRSKCPETWNFPRRILLPDFVIPRQIDAPTAEPAGGDDCDDAHLVDDTISAESQP